MHRRIVSAGVLLACLLVAMPATAQRYQWNFDRPDGHAPAGIKADFTLPKGEIYVGYRYFEETFRGSLVGTEEVTSDDVLDFFTVATPSYDRTVHELEVRYGVADWGTLEVSVPFHRNNMLKQTTLGFFQSTSDVLGDVSIRGLFRLLEMDEYRLSLTLGGTVPTGKLGKSGPTATGTGVLPYTMQGGSGSPDILIGGTFQVQNDVASIAAQFNSVIRFMDNWADYRLGNRYDFSVWGAYNVTDWVSFSLRGFFRTLEPNRRIRITHQWIGGPSRELLRPGGRTGRPAVRRKPLPPRGKRGGTPALNRVLRHPPRGPEWAAAVHGTDPGHFLANPVVLGSRF